MAADGIYWVHLQGEAPRIGQGVRRVEARLPERLTAKSKVSIRPVGGRNWSRLTLTAWRAIPKCAADESGGHGPLLPSV